MVRELNQDQLSLYPLLVDSVADYAIFLLDPRGFVMSWNAGAQRIKGYQAHEIIGRHFSTFYPAAEARAGKPDYELRVASEVGRFEDEGWRPRKDGSRFWANVVITALRNESGTLVGFGKVTRDLTERKRAEDERLYALEAERAAREQAEQARARVEAMQAVTEASIASEDRANALTAALERVKELVFGDTASVLLLEGDVLVTAARVGYPDPQAIGMRIPIGEGFAGRVAAARAPLIVEVLKDEDLFHPGLRQAGVHSLAGVPLVFEGRLVGVLHVGNFHYRRFLPVEIELLELAAERLAFALVHAEAREAERQARLEAVVAREATLLRDEFLAIAAHELKTPLTTMRLAIQVGRRRVEGHPERAGEYFELVYEQGERLTALVNQLLDVSRLQSQTVTIDLAPSNIAASARDVVSLLAESSGIAISVDAPEVVTAEVDELRLRQVLTNLVDNAVKYGSGSAIEVTVSAPSEAWVEIRVRDHGSGIPDDVSTQLFDRFIRGANTQEQSGLGLGLYIARSIVDAHGGSISALSPPDGGSEFTVRLPAHKPVVGEHLDVAVEEQGLQARL